MADLQNIVDNQLTRLSSVGSPGELPNGLVRLYADPWWHSSSFDIQVFSKRSKVRFMLENRAVDNTTWVAWNLPVGTVITLTDHHRSLESEEKVGDLTGAGGSVDLVGTGRTETADLREAGVNDAIASYFWREVDLRYGAVEMFADPNYTGIRQTLFLSEWKAGVCHNLPGSHMNDNMTAIRWRSLNDNQTVTFWEHPNKGGNSFEEATGWSGNKEMSNLSDVSFNDRVSAFMWTPVLPKKEEIQPITITPPKSNVSSQTASEEFRNNSNSEQQFKVTSSSMRTKTFSVETTQSHVVGVTASMTTTVGADVGVAKAEVSYSLGLSYEYTNTTTKKEETSEAVTVGYERQINAAPRGITRAKMILEIGDVPRTTYETRATRWYDQQVGGSSWDPANRLFKREEKTQVTVSGGLATSFATEVSFEPL